MKPTDQELVRAACHGDLESFRMLYDRHYGMAIALARSRTRDGHIAEDVAQDAFVIAYQQLSQLNDQRRFPQWLGTIVRRTAVSMVQSRKVNKPLQDDVADVTTDQAKDLTEVRTAIQRLSRSQREVIYLRYYSELSYQEIAVAIGTTTNSVHGILQRARRKLAKELNQIANG